jgi:S1-C subfamily serine protease
MAKVAQVGMKEGDEIITLDKTPVKSAGLFRKLVRRDTVAGNSGLVRVKRDGKTFELRVHFRG